MRVILFTVLVLFSLQFKAQNLQNTPCGTSILEEELIKSDPQSAENLLIFDEISRIAANSEMYKTDASLLVIPVVVHVMYKDESDNISRDQIMDAIDVLNADYRRLNADTVDTRNIFRGVATDVDVEFRLARLDPNGNCTDGITRTQTNQAVDANDNMKSLSNWNNKKYLNIWTVRSIKLSNANGIVLGYAYRPNPGQSYKKDGIVMRHDAFGTIGTSSGLGRTLTHEMGHYLGLLHPFNNGCNGGDNVADTPPVASPNFGCNPSRNSCSNDNPNLPDQIENYMDYTDGECMNMFTQGQTNVMRNALANVNLRGYLISNNNLQFTGIQIDQNLPCLPEPLYKTDKSLVCEGEFVQFTDRTLMGNPTSYLWTFQEGSPSTSTLANPKVKYNVKGSHDVSLKVTNANGSVSTFVYGRISVRAQNAPWINTFSEDFEQWKLPNNNWHVETDVDSIRFEISQTVGFNSAKSAMLNNFYIPSKRFSQMVSNSINLENSKSVVLTFDYAYAKKISEKSTDNFRVYISLDCGENWIMKRHLGGVLLNTAPPTDVEFTPNGNGQWKQSTVLLSNLAFAKNALIKFEFFSSGGGNNFYFDNVQLQTTISTEEYENGIQSMVVFPNPANEKFSIAFKIDQTDVYSLALYDLNGRLINNLLSDEKLNAGPFKLDTEIGQSIPAGIYLVEIKNSKGSVFKKLIVQ